MSIDNVQKIVYFNFMNEMTNKIYSIIKNYVNEYKIMPTFEFIEKFAGCNKNDIQLALKELVEEKKIYFDGKRYKLINYVKNKNKTRLRKRKKNNNKVISCLILLISILSLIISYYYVYMWFMNVSNFYIAILISAVMVLTNVIALEVALKMLSRKNFFGIIYLTIAIISLLFSLSSNVIGQYVVFFQKNNEIVKNTDNTHELFLELEKQEKMINDELIIKKNEREKLLSIEVDEKNRKTIEYKINQITKDIEQKNKKVNEVIEQKKELMKNKSIEKTEKRSVYQIIASIFNFDAELLHFFISVMPALLVDILSPLLAIVYLRKLY